jgi:DNA polymerase III psi subunit
MQIKISTSYVDICGDFLVYAHERIRHIEEELECPTWMLGASYRLSLSTELVRLKRRIKELELELNL